MVQSALALAIACIHGLAGHGRATWVDNATRLQTLGGQVEVGQDTAYHQQDAADTSSVSAKQRGSARRSAGKPPGQISVDVGVTVSVGAPADNGFLLVSVDRLLPARENLRQAFDCYDGDNNHIVHGELEMPGLLRHVAALVSSEEDARQLIRKADFGGEDGLDEIEFGALLDLICWHLKIKICTELQSGRHLRCEGTGAGSMQMLGSPEGLAIAHADLDAAFHCLDLDGNGKLDETELAELVEHLKTGLYFSNQQVAQALEKAKWDKEGFQELHFDCLLNLLQQAVDQINLDVE